MIDMEKSASAHLPATRFWLELGEGVAKAAAGVARGLNRTFQGSVAILEGVMARRAARRELYALGDRLLQDIGLRRDEVEQTVDAMYRHRPAEAAAENAREVEAAGSEDIVGAEASNDRHYQSVA